MTSASYYDSASQYSGSSGMGSSASMGGGFHSRSSSSHGAARFIDIPIQQTHEAVKVDLNSLPRDATQILNVLRAECAPLELWIRFAVEYYKQGMVKQFYDIVNAGTHESEMAQYYQKSKRERVILLDLRAAYHLDEAKRAKIREKKKDRDHHVQQCIESLNRSTNLDAENGYAITWVVKGLLNAFQGKGHGMVDNFYSVALSMDKHYIPALLAKAGSEYQRGSHEDALKNYQAALRVGSETCPASVRLGIGLCCMKLGKDVIAERAFHRVLQLDTTSEVAARALIGLAILEINAMNKTYDIQKSSKNSPATPEEKEKKRKEQKRKREDHTHRGMQYLEKALELQPNNSIGLVHVANHAFFAGDFQSALKTARTALQQTSSDKVKSECYYLMAKTHHMKGSSKAIQQALKFYNEACKCDPSNMLPQVGRAQILLSEGQERDAIQILEKVEKRFPEDFNTLRILGSLYASRGNLMEAKNRLDKAIKVRGVDLETSIDLVEVTQREDPAYAKLVLSKVLKPMQKNTANMKGDQFIQLIALQNNLAVVTHKVEQNDRKQPKKAVKLFKDLIGVVKSGIKAMGSKSGPLKEHLMTIKFNLARTLESEEKYDDAEKYYKEVLDAYPDYIDCVLRLGVMSKTCGKNSDAQKYLKRAMKIEDELNETLPVSKKSINARLLYSEYILDQGKSQEAKQALTDAQKVVKDDPYTLLSFGNLYIATMGTFDRDENLNKASKYFRKLLMTKSQKNNVYAVNGLGVILAEKGYLGAAKDIFHEIQKATASKGVTRGIPEVLLNLGHIRVVEENYNHACTLYYKALDLDKRQRSRILLCIARAHFLNEKLDQCKEVLNQGLSEDPKNEFFRYNLALAQEEQAIQILQKPYNKREFKEVELAYDNIKQAQQNFGLLEKGGKINSDKCRKHREYCEKNYEKAKKHLEYAKSLELKKLKEKKEAVAVIEAKKREQQLRVKEIEKQKAAQEELLQNMISAREKKHAVSKETWKRTSYANGDSDFMASDDDNGETSKKKRRKRRREQDDMYEVEQNGDQIDEAKTGADQPADPTPSNKFKLDPLFQSMAGEGDSENDEDFKPVEDRVGDHDILPEDDAEDPRYVHRRTIDEPTAGDGVFAPPKEATEKKKKRKLKKRSGDSSDEGNGLPQNIDDAAGADMTFSMPTNDADDGAEDYSSLQPTPKKKRRVLDEDDEDDDDDVLMEDPDAQEKKEIADAITAYLELAEDIVKETSKTIKAHLKTKFHKSLLRKHKSYIKEIQRAEAQRLFNKKKPNDDVQ